MIGRVAVITLACLVGACPIGASAKPRHARSSHVLAYREAPTPFVLHVQSISYDRQANRAQAGREFVPGPIGAADRIPLGAADHFGRGGVASIGYQTGASRSPIEAHELNAAFSSQPIGFGGAVGGDVSLNF